MRRFTAILTAATLLVVAGVHLQATDRPTGPVRIHATPRVHVPPHAMARFRRLAPLSDMPLSAADDADLDDATEVIGVAIEGQARAYVLAALEFPDHVYHDELSGKHFSVTYCERTGCARVFQRNKGDELEVGGWSGTGMMLIVDGEYWQQDLPGFPLRDLDSSRTTWAQWRQEHPSSKVYIGQHRSRLNTDAENPCPDHEPALQAASETHQIPIGPERWATTRPDEVSANVYLGRRSQHFNSVEHISRLRGLHLKNGKIEFDLASRNPRNPPWIHMGIGSKSPAKLSLHPRPQTALPCGPSLYRLVLTRNEMTSVVAMYRQPRAEFDPGSWVHVSIECRSNQCRVFLNHNETPLFLTGRFFEPGGFGVQGEGYIANLRLTTE